MNIFGDGWTLAAWLPGWLAGRLPLMLLRCAATISVVVLVQFLSLYNMYIVPCTVCLHKNNLLTSASLTEISSSSLCGALRGVCSLFHIFTFSIYVFSLCCSLRLNNLTRGGRENHGGGKSERRVR